MSAVYWIHHTDHTDMFSQGYVGVSNNTRKRWYDHKTTTENQHLKSAINKYGWDNLVKKVIVLADKSYCLDIETKLRPTSQIGWNIVAGGGNPPSALGRKDSEEVRRKKAASKYGNKHGLGVVFSQERRTKISVAKKGNNGLNGHQNGLKYTYIGTNIATGEQIQLTGNAQIKKAGFHSGHVNDCTQGRAKTHKGYKWIKESIK